MTYFRMGRPQTIIGAKWFHFRVRDGIGWFTLAMVARKIGDKFFLFFYLYFIYFIKYSYQWVILLSRIVFSSLNILLAQMSWGYMAKPHG